MMGYNGKTWRNMAKRRQKAGFAGAKHGIFPGLACILPLCTPLQSLCLYAFAPAA
jgi:hypothetical protein